jgi:serine/threonine protein phosphatase PrpC
MWSGSASVATLHSDRRAALNFMLSLEFAQISDIGRVREGNEDYMGFVSPDAPDCAGALGWLFVVADGVGGHEKGEVASRTAVEAVVEAFRAVRKDEPFPGLIRRLVQGANASVFKTALDGGPSSAGMATTIVACALRYDRAVVAHVGDSRCYLIRGEDVEVLTRDHTLAQEHVRLGLLSQEEACEAENRHMLSRSVGIHLTVDVEIQEHTLIPGDVLLLCSDGLHGTLKNADLVNILAPGADLQEAAKRLVSLANERDGSDNATAQLIRVKSVERVGMYRGRPYKIF